MGIWGPSVALATEDIEIGKVKLLDASGTNLGAVNAAGQLSVASAASLESGTVYVGSSALTPQFATIVASSSGATQVVAAVTSKRIRVLYWELIANGTVNVKFQSHVTPTDITGLKYLVANTGINSGAVPWGTFQTIAGEALDINLSASVAVGGELVYVTV